MNSNDLTSLLPMIVISAMAIIIMLGISVRRCHRFTYMMTVAASVLSLLSLAYLYPEAPHQVTPLILVDHYALLYMGLIILSGLLTALLSYGYIRDFDINHDEYYVLLLIATLGAMTLVCSSHFASFFLGLEILSASLFTLIAYPKSSLKHSEAGIKYLVLASASSAFLLFGMALVYAETGSMELQFIANAAQKAGFTLPYAAGLVMIVVGIGFKLGLVPFHMWTADVYEGAPAPVTAFIATVSKGAIFALLLRYFSQIDIHQSASLMMVFSFLAFFSMVVGNLLALFQNNIKRILAYSSIAHLGYLVVAFLAGGALAAKAVTFYLVAYFITTFGAFGIIILLSAPDRDADSINDYRGLARKRPLLAAVFTAMLFSLAGIPLTAGFIGKFYLISAGASAELWALVITLVLSSVIGLFYYLRIIVAIYAQPSGDEAISLRRISVTGRLVLAALVLLLVWIGIYPVALLDGISIFIGRIG
jgi:NADH-quinone oxidoreductase subunit N